MAACYADLDSFALREKVLSLLGQLVPADGAFFATADPVTLLYTSAVRVGMPPGVTPLFLHNEFAQNDVNKFRSLATGAEPVSWLDRATQGDRFASPRYREIMRPIGLGDELRAALRTRHSCWGFLCLHRQDGATGFSPGEAALIATLVPHLAEGLRRSVLLERCELGLDPDGPGAAVIEEDGSVSAMTPAAQRWLSELAGPEAIASGALPMAAQTVLGQLRLLTESEAVGGTVPCLTTRTASGRWLELHASWLVSERCFNRASLMIEPARPAQLAPVIIAAYGLTPRETEVATRLLRGLPTKRIAAECRIAEHTVRDHIKAIFEKAGVGTRGELVAAVFRISRPGPHQASGGRPESTRKWLGT